MFATSTRTVVDWVSAGDEAVPAGGAIRSVEAIGAGPPPDSAGIGAATFAVEDAEDVELGTGAAPLPVCGDEAPLQAATTRTRDTTATAGFTDWTLEASRQTSEFLAKTGDRRPGLRSTFAPERDGGGF